jgi:uncharacterized protein YcbK (DUF882 family)
MSHTSAKFQILFFKIFLFLISLTALACSPMRSTPVAPNSGPSVGPTSDGHQACFSNLCLTTVEASALADPNKDYKYQDPRDFPTEKLQNQYLAPIRFVDLKNLDISGAVEKNFLLGDFMDVSRGRYGLFSPAVAAILQAMHDELGAPIIINSGYRSPGHNNQTSGSALWSRHMYGDAIDFTTPKANYPALQTLCQKYRASFTLIYAAHIHCDWRLLPLDTVFYGVGFSLPLSTDSIDSHRLAKQMADAGQIVVVNSDAQTLTLATQLPDLEPEDDTPIYRWSVTLPDHRTVTGENAEISLPKNAGRYTIKLEIGGSIFIERTLDL